MWDWLQSLSGGAANFVGSLTGSMIGLFALLIGALVNAHLNRKRDDRLRREDQRAVAAALRAELGGLRDALLESQKGLNDPHGGVLVPDLALSVKIMPNLLPKLGLLDPETIQSVMDAYLLMYEYRRKLLLTGGHLAPNMPPDSPLVFLPPEKGPSLSRMQHGHSEVIKKAVAKLDAYLSAKPPDGSWLSKDS